MRILVISQYPINPAVHGGQKRTAEIVSFYKKKHEVRYVGVYWPDTYKVQNESSDSKQIVVSDKRYVTQLQLHPERSDLLLGRALSGRSKYADELREVITSFNPTIIHVEQPYLIPSLQIILARMKRRVVIVHGSQNIEHELKRSIYSQILPRKDFNYLVKHTRAVENKAIELADINIGVSRQDIKTLRQYSKGIWLFAGNGTDYVDDTPDRSRKSEHHSTIVFIGSAHPPNYIGIDSLLKDTQFLGEQGSLLLIGGIADYFVGKYPNDDSFWANKIAIGKVNDNDLRKYIQQADVIVLPISTGGGSNLKTAEAIASRKKIVSTSFAFRGYEQYESLPNILIANTADEFRARLLQAIVVKKQPYTDKQVRLIEHLSWETTLRPLAMVSYYARALLFLDRLKRALGSESKP